MALPTTPPSEAIAPYDTFDFAHKRVDSTAIYALSLTDARIVRGIVFGRHGRPFDDDADIKKYLEGRPWYKRDSAFTNAKLNDTERDNLDIIRGAEAAHHQFIEPGDLRFVGNKVVTRAMVGQHTPAEWRQLTTELGAIHGQTWDDFPDEEEADSSTSIQYYYDHRYWYKRSADKKPTPLTPAERALDDTITLAYMLFNGDHAMPGGMRFFQTRQITRKQLDGHSLYYLRLMRNEFFALHGHKFETPWLRDYFKDYQYRAEGVTTAETPLTDIEKSNVALIQQVENEKHDALVNQLLEQRDLFGLEPEDARLLRNEIYARHGRPFKDPVLRSYFVSQAWYKPNPRFSDDSLTALEKENVATISGYERLARRGMRFPEG